MKFQLCGLFLILCLFLSCQDENEKRKEEQEKVKVKNEMVFKAIDKAWFFNTPNMESEAQTIANNWTEWRSFLTEINQKPRSTMGAFQKKASALATKAAQLNNNIPPKYNIPQIKSRIAVLVTKIKSLDLYIQLQEIPKEKVIVLIPEINAEIVSLQMQMQEVVRKTKIPMEEGEADMIKMRDTTRAIPNSTIQKP